MSSLGRFYPSIEENPDKYLPVLAPLILNGAEFGDKPLNSLTLQEVQPDNRVLAANRLSEVGAIGQQAIHRELQTVAALKKTSKRQKRGSQSKSPPELEGWQGGFMVRKEKSILFNLQSKADKKGFLPNK